MLLLSTAINMRREEEGRGGKGRGGKGRGGKGRGGKGRTKEGKREGKGRERERETYTGKKFLVISIAGAARWKLNSVTIGGVAGVAGRVEEGSGGGRGRGRRRGQRLFGGFICFCFLVIRFICLLFCVLCFIGDIICFCLLILWLFCLHFLVLSILFVFVETSLLAGFVGF